MIHVKVGFGVVETLNRWVLVRRIGWGVGGWFTAVVGRVVSRRDTHADGVEQMEERAFKEDIELIEVDSPLYAVTPLAAMSCMMASSRELRLFESSNRPLPPMSSPHSGHRDMSFAPPH